MKNNFTSGGIFATRLEKDQGYVFGRILLDIKKLLRDGLISKKQQLSFFTDAFLVEAFDHIGKSIEDQPKDKRAIRGLFVDREAAADGTWQKVVERPVKAQDLEFPEYLLNMEGTIYLIKGEIQVPLEISVGEADRINCRPTMHSSLSFGDLLAKATDREDLILPFWRDKITLSTSDLRFADPKVRKHVFDLADLDANLAYNELCNLMGIDNKRLLTSN